MIGVIKILMHVIKREKQPWFIFATAIGMSTLYLTFDAIYMYGDVSITYTYYTIILCQKLSTLGFCYRDGLPEYEKQLSSHAKRCKLDEIPTVIEILSYN